MAENCPIIKLVSVFNKGKLLILPGWHPEISTQILIILQKMQSMISHLFQSFPQKVFENKRLTLQEVVDLVEDYNKVAKPYALTWSGSYNTENLGDWGYSQCKDDVAQDIVNWAYGMVINPQIYYNNEANGKPNLNEISKICDEARIGEHDVFVDLGCGVGQFVYFVAAYARCKKTIGIEISDQSFKFATEVSGYFEKLMAHFGKRFGKFEISHGDFLEEKYRALICEEATVLFINNKMFDETLTHQLKVILRNLKAGTKVITTKPVCDIRHDDVNGDGPCNCQEWYENHQTPGGTGEESQKYSLMVIN
ncbi:hypothetical protein GCK72_022776 [Caenorhabditis remanei]|uniref:Histone-lysine N-methyltransferase, H3 lysine-79 specific n=1 Tax=Caenorhabditis remanei TaxID=31234 RepID=A0A6A5FUV8_CAERE|nr:hypothetical protein GCK72_022776 [Caenorhabditis remanei]KAF1746323.1 hypothetical protein GCK72_022776 [Caenorhabditis remanei]